MKPAPKSLRNTSEADLSKWSATQIEILEAARHLIADEGYHNFSMRSIAQRCDIHLKSLQYHFRTKREMLSAVVDYTIENYYFQSYDQLFAQKQANTPQKRFEVMLDYLLDDLGNEFTARLFPELWALASHDKDVADALDVFYCRHVESIAEIIELLNPGLSRGTVVHRAALIAMMIEGLLLIIGYGKRKHPMYEDLKESAKATIAGIVRSPENLRANPGSRATRKRSS